MKRMRMNLLTASLVSQLMGYDDINTCTILVLYTVLFISKWCSYNNNYGVCMLILLRCIQDLNNCSCPVYYSSTLCYSY